MMTGNDFIEIYIKWLKEKMSFSNIGNNIEITTPFLDNHNDHIQIYIKQIDNKLLLSDDGVTLSELKMAGCDLSTERRKNILNNFLNGMGVKLQNHEIFIEANEYNFPQKKHSLLQAILSVSDMFMLAQNRVASVFLEDVERFLSINDIRYTHAVQFTGKSGFQHTFDFVIPASKKMPERLIRAINSPTKEKTESVLFSWNDTKEMRQKDSSMYVFMNDYDKSVKTDNIYSAFLQYGVRSVVWSKRESVINELAA